jgi:hypothetical protein
MKKIFVINEKILSVKNPTCFVTKNIFSAASIIGEWRLPGPYGYAAPDKVNPFRRAGARDNVSASMHNLGQLLESSSF